MTAVDFITNLAPHYRQRLWLDLLGLDAYRVRFFFGREPRSSIKQIDLGLEPWSSFADRLTTLRNVRFGRVLVWQSGVVTRAATTPAAIVICYGDMYVVSTWLAVIILRVRRRRVVFWGHGLYGRETGIKKRMRLAFLRLADLNLVYGGRARRLLIDHGLPEKQVMVIYNSLDYPAQKALRASSLDVDCFRRMHWFTRGDLPVLIFVGRLSPQKRLDTLISAVEQLNANGPRFNVLFVGDGPERARLERLAGSQSGQIHFFGACYDEAQLARLITNAELCVSPGEIGLTAIHVLSYGTPACTHNDLNHQMPEAEAIIEGVTGTFFDAARGDLAARIEAWFAANRDRGEVRAACYQVVDDQFNPRVQCRILCDALSSLSSPS